MGNPLRTVKNRLSRQIAPGRGTVSARRPHVRDPRATFRRVAGSARPPRSANPLTRGSGPLRGSARGGSTGGAAIRRSAMRWLGSLGRTRRPRP